MKATITVAKATLEDYGMHGQTHWDDFPYAVYYPLYAIVTRVVGKHPWGSAEGRGGEGTLAITQCHFTEHDQDAPGADDSQACRQRAAEYVAAAVKTILLLQPKCEVEIRWQDKETPLDHSQETCWLDGGPPKRLQRKISPTLSLENLR